MDAIASLWGLLTSGQRRRLRRALLLMLAGAAAELLTIGALVSFLALLTGTGRVSAAVADRLSLLGAEPVIVAALAFTIAAVMSAAVRLALSWHAQRFALEVGQELAGRIFSRMLRQPYSDYVQRNSSEVLAGIERVQVVIFGILVPVMQGFIAAFIALSIATLLLFINAPVTILAVLFFVGLYAALGLATRRRLSRASISVAAAGKARIKTVQEGLGGMRDIILDRSQHLFEDKFRRLDARYRKAQAATLFIATASRFVVEAAAAAALSLILVIFSFRAGGIAHALPVVGALALAGQRLLPLIQQVFVGWSYASGNLQPLRDVIELTQAPLSADEAESGGDIVPLGREIVLDAVAFSYGSNDFALQDISFVIPKGARLGIAGPTGSGKSTLVDLLMGLLEPTAGAIRIDGRLLDSASRIGWRTQIAHVPQSIYLLDDTIAANIAFGVADDTLSIDSVRAAAAAACIDDFIDGLPQGYRTQVGERGIRLSGGQRQRLGIARALYKRVPVLILDEATSALDEEAEARVMRSIGARRDMTVIVVAHRATTLAVCDAILRLEGGMLVSVAVEGALNLAVAS